MSAIEKEIRSRAEKGNTNAFVDVPPTISTEIQEELVLAGYKVQTQSSSSFEVKW